MGAIYDAWLEQGGPDGKDWFEFLGYKDDEKEVKESPKVVVQFVEKPCECEENKVEYVSLNECDGSYYLQEPYDLLDEIYPYW